uniref:Large ribosomal subunit protein bL28c n=1 Tax=Galdieria sulphuraria TaxID=130081 RepID=A0A075W3Q0_GALSU|nr:ribosomal protein L28 [Galdieria sulphuraria]AIG92600.1 ribosomal protein L28 [Galdieria sulphuraria]
MTRKCQLLFKNSNTANQVSHSNHKSKRLQFVNLQKKKVWSSLKKKWIKLRISTKMIKILNKKNIDYFL